MLRTLCGSKEKIVLTTALFLLIFLGSGKSIYSVPLNTGQAVAIDPALADRLNQAGANELINALLVLKDRVATDVLNARLKLETRTRLARHQRVIFALQEKAHTTQGPLLSQLKHDKQAGRVLAYKGYWIDNIVWVRGTKVAIERAIEHPSVSQAFLQPKIELIEPVFQQPAAQLPGSAEKGLQVIGARQMWAQGYTGQGRLVCNFDNGVDGNHRAFKTRWRGYYGVPASAAWFDPVGNLTTPHTFAVSNNWHGTHTLGTICGVDTATADTIGVAIRAQWISAGVVDVAASTSYHVLDAFEWAMDPDGDPNTIEDVPDVISNSWGFAGVGCSSLFWNAIDNIEAAGCVTVWAAGNEGPGAATIRNPSNRIASSTNTFSIGAVDGNTAGTPIASFSSRGPSDCDGLTIKPEVVAPGFNVRSAMPGTLYGLASGTSMATPHVAGAVALLRQFNPNATVDTIKWALLSSATDLGSVGEDNTYGKGLINLPAALALMPPNTGVHLYVKRDIIIDSMNPSPQPGDTVLLYLILANNGRDTAFGIWGRLSSNSGFVTILQDSAFFGQIVPNDTGNNQSTLYRLAFDSATTPSVPIYFNLELFTDSGALDTIVLQFQVGPLLAKSLATHDVGNCQFTISNFGLYGFASGSMVDRGSLGKGFTYPKVGSNNLFECGLLTATDAGHISNGVRGSLGEDIDRDFRVAVGGNLVFDEPGIKANEQSFSIFNDSNATSPLGLEISQASYALSDTGADDFVIVRYIIHNRSGALISGLRVGLFCDWDYPWGSGNRDKVNFDRSRALGYMWDNTTGIARGIQVLNDTASSYRAINNSASIYDGFSDAEKWQFLSGGITDTTFLTAADASHLLAVGPYTLNSGDSVTVAFAIVGGSTITDLKNHATQARDKYQQLFPNFILGDVNADSIVDLSDCVALIDYVFIEGSPPSPPARGDVNCDSVLDIIDCVLLVNKVFYGENLPCEL